MYVKRLELTNFKKHKHLAVDFQEGSNMIVGNNYAGKSTIEQAILVGLFGNSAAPGTVDSLINRDATNFSVKLELSDGTIITRSSKNSSASHTGESEPFAVGHTAVNAAIVELLGINKGTFLKVYTSEQGSPQQLLQMEGMELQRFIEGCLGMDRMDKAITAVRQMYTESKAIAVLSQTKMLPPGKIEEILLVVSQNKNALFDIESQKEVLLVNIKKQKSLLDLLQEEFVKGTHHNDKVDKYHSKKEEFSKVTLQEVPDVTELEQELEAIESSLKIWADINASTKRHNRAISVLEKIPPNLDVPIWVDPSALQGDLRSLDLNINTINNDIHLLSRQLHDSSCPTCKRPFEGIKDVNGLKDLLAGKESELIVKKRYYGEIKEKLHRISAQNSERDLVVRNNETYSQQREQVSLEIDRAKAEIKLTPVRNEEELSELRSYMVRKLRIAYAEIDNVTSSNKRYLELKAAFNTMVDPGLDKVDLPALGLTIKETTAAIYSSSDALRETESSAGSINNSLTQSKALLSNHYDSKKDFDDYAVMSDNCKAIQDVLTENRSKVISDGTQVMFDVATQFVKGCTDGAISKVSLETNGIQYIEDGYVMDKACASGAQKTLIGLGMKLGVGQLISSHWECLLLDEVSADMSEEISLRCLLGLNAYSNQNISISHRGMDIAGNVIQL